MHSWVKVKLMHPGLCVCVCGTVTVNIAVALLFIMGSSTSESMHSGGAFTAIKCNATQKDCAKIEKYLLERRNKASTPVISECHIFENECGFTDSS